MNGSKNTVWAAGTGGIALVMLAATYFGLVAPQREAAAEVREQTAGVVQSNLAIEQKTELLAAQFATLDEQKARLAEVRATLPGEAQVPTLLRQLEGYAASAGVTLTAVTPSAASAYATDTAATTDTSGLVQIPLAVTATGGFGQSELFVKNLQADMARFFLVEDVSVTAGGQSASSGDVTTTLTGRIFVLGDATTSTATAEPVTTGSTATGTADATTTPATAAADSSTTASVN
ncbi:type 4a pilus biogenesis protein PilO [Kineococcus auxinigenes]|uniref:type 4a pilus biogenesis protein PilO n=1 Tax=unclassified Kineococcus TaxID=2621656 RepID=UPI003D7CBE29